jgi:hypothetical protein
MSRRWGEKEAEKSSWPWITYAAVDAASRPSLINCEGRDMIDALW